MPSKTSWFNKQLILQIIRSSGWISLIYFVGLLFALPLRALMVYSDDKANGWISEPARNLFQYDMGIQIGLLIAIPVLLAVFLFRFLQVKQAAEMMHSLPIRREKIFHHYVLFGMTALVLPVVLTALIVMIMHTVIGLHDYFAMKDIWIWTGTTILLNLLLFLAGVFVAMMTGISAVQGALTYIFLLFPAGIIVLVVTNLKQLLFGFPGDYFYNSNIEKMSPLTFISMIDEGTLKWKETVIYAVITIILYGLSLYFYKKRKSESASEAIAFPKLRFIFKYGVTFCMTLFGGMYFSVTQSSSGIGWVIFGYIIGAVIGYYMAEMLLQKTWRVFSKVKGLLIYSVSITVIISGVQALNLYENKVPEQDEVKNVIFTNTPYVNMDQRRHYGFAFALDSLKEQKNIQAVRKLHQRIISDKEVIQSEEAPYETAFFLYELNNGKKVIRQYSVDKSLYDEWYEPINESEEYKRATHEIFHLEADKIDSFNITARSSLNKNVTISNPEDISEFIEIFKADVLAESYGDSVYYQDLGSSAEFFINQNNSVYINIKPTYKGLEQWLEERELLERTRVMPADVAYIQIVKEKGALNINPEEFAAEIEKRSDALKVDDKEQINELLLSMGSSPHKNQYAAVLYYAGRDYPEVFYMDEKHAPEFVKEHFR